MKSLQSFYFLFCLLYRQLVKRFYSEDAQCRDLACCFLCLPFRGVISLHNLYRGYRMATITIQLLRRDTRTMVFGCFQENAKRCLDFTSCFSLFISRRNYDALSHIPRNSKGGSRCLEKNESVLKSWYRPVWCLPLLSVYYYC